MDANDVRTLYAYNRWANQRMFATLEKLSDAQLTATRESSFPSLWESAFHIVGAEWIWLKRWKGVSPRASVAHPDLSPAVWDGLTPGGPPAKELAQLSALRYFAETIERERQNFLTTLTEAALQSDFQYSGMDGVSYSAPLVEVMQHLVNHGSYHRGQITTLLRQAGGQAVPFDMIYFFRERRSNTTNV